MVKYVSSYDDVEKSMGYLSLFVRLKSDIKVK
jgi:hypothetical protein